MTITRFPRAPFSAAEMGDASFVIAPERGTVVEAGSLVREAFGWWQKPWHDVRLDAAMPGLIAVRAFAASADGETDQDRALIFWTRNGALNVNCRLERAAHGTEANAVRVHVVRVNGSSWPAMMPLPPRRQSAAAAQASSKPPVKTVDQPEPAKQAVSQRAEAEQRAEPRQIAQASFMIARHGEPSLTLVPHDALTHVTGRTDEATLELIAKRIREGILSGAVIPAPDSADAMPMFHIKDFEHKNGGPSAPIAPPMPPISGAHDFDLIASNGDASKPTKPAEGEPSHTAADPFFERAVAMEPVAAAEPVMAASEPDAPGDDATNNAAEPVSSPAPEPQDVPDTAVSRTLAQIAHDIKTPLSAISAASEIIRDDRLGPGARDKYKAYAADIHASARHALDIVDRLMREAGQRETASSAGTNNAAPETPKMKPASSEPPKSAQAKSTFDVNAVLSACAKQVRPLTDQRHQKLLLRLDPSASQITADTIGFKQSVLNLLTNAMKFTPAGGSITIETMHLASGGVIVAVLDTGRGMTKGAVARQVDPDLVAGQATAPTTTGLGLGLPQVRAFCAKNGATLGMESALGQGTVVSMTFKP